MGGDSGQGQPVPGIEGLSVPAQFKVERGHLFRIRLVCGADHLSLCHPLADRALDRCQARVNRMVAAAVLDDEQVAVAAKRRRVDDFARCHRSDGRVGRGADVEARVGGARAGAQVNDGAKPDRDHAFDRKGKLSVVPLKKGVMASGALAGRGLRANGRENLIWCAG